MKKVTKGSLLKRLNSLRISTKLISGFAVIFLLTSFACYLGYSGLSNLESEMEFIAEDKQIYSDAQAIKNLMLQHRRYEKDLFLNIGNRKKQTEKYLPKLQEKQAEIQTLLQRMQIVIGEDPRFSPETKQVAAALVQMHQRYMDGVLAIADNAINDPNWTPQEANQAMEPFKEPIHDLESGIDLVADATTELFMQRIETSKGVAARSRVAMVAGAVLALVPCPFIVMIVVGPLRKVSRLLADIAKSEGDLTLRLPVERNDEIGELSVWFNKFVDQMQAVMIRVGENASALVSSSSQLTGTAAELSENAGNTTNRSAFVMAESNQMVTRMSHASQSTQSMQLNISSVANAIEELAASINDISGNTEQASAVAMEAARELKESNANIVELGKAAMEINRVVETIEDIAEQTNLLALNATIEAARAGEAGKGFSIVANEVKELARQAASATEGIRARIDAIQMATDKTTRSINDVGKHVAKVNDVSAMIAAALQEQNATTQTIAEHISETSSAVTEISNGVSKSAEASEGIRSSMQAVDLAAQETAHGASSTRRSGDDVHRIADDLKTLLSQFRVI
ncbi:methyl-accepting chemotaxis protein [Bremerella cremea]|uniref:Methyl-accepting chemotaxis protein n=1 Tax=Bremerella cremea TaxID=1031537 RepID=A0A368KXS2_9BACT|nr:methyl-accepting chemotaxis protein [Bremerella cremea]RCS54254.1 methyl-accepting chemotaxis protein [Bremerella cremea]